MLIAGQGGAAGENRSQSVRQGSGREGVDGKHC
jgi:hypothetical protein